MQKNLEVLGDIEYSQEEIDFAIEMQKANGKPTLGIDGKIRPLRETLESPGGGSTDVGDVSYNVPVVSLAATTAPKGVPWHSWSVVASSGMSIGHKGMMHAAKALGMTMIDIFKDKKLREEIKKDTEIGKKIINNMNDGKFVSDEIVNELIKNLKAKNFPEVRKWVVTNMDNDSTVLFRRIYDSLYECLVPATIPAAVLVIAKYQYQTAFVADQEINMLACLTEIMVECEFK